MDADGFVRIADFGLCKEGKDIFKAFNLVKVKFFLSTIQTVSDCLEYFVSVMHSDFHTCVQTEQIRCV